MLTSFLVALILVCVVVYALYVVINFLKVPDPIRTLAFLLIGVVALLYLLHRFGAAFGVSV